RNFDAAVSREQTVLEMHAHRGNDHHRDNERRTDRSEKSEREQKAAGDFGRRSKRREEPAWSKADGIEESCRSGESMPAEPAEQLLAAVRRHQQAEHDPHDKQSDAGRRDIDEWCCHLSSW